MSTEPIEEPTAPPTTAPDFSGYFVPTEDAQECLGMDAAGVGTTRNGFAPCDEHGILPHDHAEPVVTVTPKAAAPQPMTLPETGAGEVGTALAGTACLLVGMALYRLGRRPSS